MKEKINKKNYELVKTDYDDRKKCTLCCFGDKNYKCSIVTNSDFDDCMFGCFVWQKKSKAASPIVEKVEVIKQPIELTWEQFDELKEDFNFEGNTIFDLKLKSFVEYVLNNYKP